MKLSRTKLVIFGLLFGLVVLVRYVIRDMNLDVDLLRESLQNVPALVMENIQFSRKISGDMWRVLVPYLERDDDIVTLQSLDIRRTLAGSGDRSWYFFGQRGIYSSDKKAASISGLMGTLENSNRTWTLESSQIFWQDGTDSLVFPNGLTIYDEEFSVMSHQASMDKNGVILLEQGGVIQWSRPLPQ